MLIALSLPPPDFAGDRIQQLIGLKNTARYPETWPTALPETVPMLANYKGLTIRLPTAMERTSGRIGLNLISVYQPEAIFGTLDAVGTRPAGD